MTAATDRVRRARRATKLRHAGSTWSTIAAELGYASATAAHHAALRYGGFSGTKLRGTCRTCGAKVKRTGARGRLPEYCPAHRRVRITERASARQEAQAKTRTPASCADCGGSLQRPLGRRVRCVDCANRRRLKLRRIRDGRRDPLRHAKAKAHGRNSAYWRAIRAAVLERDGHRCRSCGATEHLTVHLSPRLKGNHLRARLVDCTTLCRRCHGRVDGPRGAVGT
jgi:5-methylcytosine-specific restriction endonuclease McrA